MKHANNLFALLALSFGIATTSSVFAAGNHDHSPKFGGIVAVGKAFDVELVAKPELITVYVSDHSKPMSAKGAKGKITLLSGTDKSEIDLVPAGDNKLEAKGKFNVGPGTKAVVVIAPEGKAPGAVRFTIK